MDDSTSILQLTHSPALGSRSTTILQRTHMPTDRKSFKDVVRHFTPAWFIVNMGTGVIASLFQAYPYGNNSKVMNIFALIFFFLNVILFIIFFAMSITRYILFPPVWRFTLHHPVQSLSLGCFPIGAFTLISCGLTVVRGNWGFGGVKFLYFLWAFWWLDSILSLLCCFGLIHVMTTRQRHSMSTLTPFWLLPVVTLTVASSVGQLLASEIGPYSLPHALLTIGVSIVMTAIGVSLALMLMTLYVCRLIIEGLPEVSFIICVFIPLGSCGQAGYSLLLAGQNFEPTLAWVGGNGMADQFSGKILHVICLCCAFVLWCMGVWWLVSAIVAVIDTAAQARISFKLDLWGLVFPNGIHALLTIRLGTVLEIRFFRVLGAVYGAVVLLIWLALAVPTLTHVYDGSIFHAPDLEDHLMQLASGPGKSGQCNSWTLS